LNYATSHLQRKTIYTPDAIFVSNRMSLTAVPAMTQSGEPIMVLKEGRTQSKGRSAMENNIAAAKLICEIVCTSLGPHGMDKLILEPYYEGSRVTVTNDGAFMLKKMLIQHPAAKILVDVSKVTDNGVGDGTTSAVVLAGALLEKADELLQRGLHPVILVDGFQKAAKKAEELLESIAERVDPRDRAMLENVARTSMQSKIIGKDSGRIASLVVDAALAVSTEQEDGTFRVDMKDIRVEKKQGGSIADTELIAGMVLGQRVVHPDREGQDSHHREPARDRRHAVQVDDNHYRTVASTSVLGPADRNL